MILQPRSYNMNPAEAVQKLRTQLRLRHLALSTEES